MVQTEQEKAALQVIAAVADAIRELKEVPSGHLYAHLMGRMSLESYNKIISILKDAGMITERNHVLRWIG